MKKIFSVLLLLISIVSFGQNPVSWQVSSTILGDSAYEIKIEADLDKGWHLYSQFLESDEGPLSTYITYETSNFELIGKTEELGVETHMDPVWEMDISFFSDHAIFIQKVKSLNPDSLLFEGNVNFMVCDDSQCLPPEDYAFQVNLSAGSEVIEDVVYKTDEATLAIIPKLDCLDLDNPVNDCGEKSTEEERKSNWLLFIFGLVGGLVSLFTPCVFPMIPLTVSFFTKGGSNKGSGVAKALLYGFSIVAVYASLSLPFYFSGTDPEILNQISTSFTLNIVFFLIFVAFAISFFGYYELTLPSSWANKADKAADLGGIVGVIFMALVLAIVSFSCTGPLLGSVLAGSLKDGAVPITFAMLGFGVGLGLPFTIFAAFPSLLKKLPQSGGWLNSVKVVLGFVELGLAVKFLSNADFVYRFGIVHRETFYLVWIILGVATAAYLFGLFRFPHDSKGLKLSIYRKGLGIAFLSFAIYLVPGVLPQKSQMWDTKLIAGFPPSIWYSWYNTEVKPKLDGITLEVSDPTLAEEAANIDNYEDLYAFISKNNKNEVVIHYHITDYTVGLNLSKYINKPLLVDFTGYACVNCRKMEENVWTDEKVGEILEKNYVIVSLYVDDKITLSEELQGEITVPLSDGSKKQKKIKTVGDKWATFESIRFGQVSQPYYVLLSPEEYLLTNPVAYTPDSKVYADWLTCGVDAFEKLIAGKVDLSGIECGKEVVAENIQPIAWSFSANSLGNNEYEIILNGAIEEGWHTYSTTLPMSDEGPLGSWITFDESDNYELIDEIIEENAHSYFDETWEMDIVDFAWEAIFKQKVKVLAADEFILKGNINFMVCKDGACLPPEDAPFEITITP